MSLFHTHIVVGWSARSRPSPKRTSKDAIWWAVAYTDGSAAKAPKYVRTRHDALRCLVRLVAGELDVGRRVLVGFDFPFGYPSGVAGRASDRPRLRPRLRGGLRLLVLAPIQQPDQDERSGSTNGIRWSSSSTLLD